MSKRLLLILLSVVVSISAFSRSVIYWGRVADMLTNMDLPGASVEVLSQSGDSVLRTISALSVSYINGVEYKKATYCVQTEYNDKKDGASDTLRLRVKYPGYEDAYLAEPVVFGRRQNQKTLPVVMMKRKPRQLDEVTVTASKVKFYYRGDTLVYNADAFVLAEGSMLDALISQLPGVELKPDGMIYVQGKPVESLLLNGKDFFSSNRKLLLDNLGAYTVKNIDVYDKTGRNSEFVGRKIGGDSRYVMDVKLKKEYSRSTILNLEAGGGTDSRWLGRLFAMQLGDRNRYTVYAASNNLNDSRQPGQSDSWTQESVQPGEKTQTKGGVDYSVETKSKKWEFKGSVDGSHDRGTLEQTSFQQNFLTQGDTYEQSSSRSTSRNWSVSTGHEAYTRWSLVSLRLRPSFSYGQSSGRNRSVTSVASDEAMENLVNSSHWFTDNHSHRLNAALNLNSLIKFKTNPDYIELTGDVKYHTDWNENNRRFDIDYAEQDNVQSQHQRYKNHPNRQLSANMSVKYEYKWPRSIVTSLAYEADYTKERKRSDMYLVERVADATLNRTISDIYEEVPDFSNSYLSRQWDLGHRIVPRLVLNSSKFWVQFCMPVELRHQEFHYERGGRIYDVNRNSVVLTAYDTFMRYAHPVHKYKIWLEYRLNTDLPSMTSLVDMTDATDPLNIFEGNPSLRNAYAHSAFVQFEPRSRDHVLTIGAGATTNALVNGYNYDSNTGIRRFKTYNVDGDWNAYISSDNDFTFGKDDCMSLNSQANVEFHNAVDMIGENGIMPRKSNIHNLGIGETLDYKWQLGSQMIGAKISGRWRHSTSPDNHDFKAIDAGNLTYGLTGLFKLPANFEISTDIGVDSRFGYNAAVVNKSDILWNARVSCTLGKGKWLIALDGFDLLNQLRNVSYSVNPQGRVEVRTNTLPRYALLHVQYRLNLLPKKRK